MISRGIIISATNHTIFAHLYARGHKYSVRIERNPGMFVIILLAHNQMRDTLVFGMDVLMVAFT